MNEGRGFALDTSFEKANDDFPLKKVCPPRSQFSDPVNEGSDRRVKDISNVATAEWIARQITEAFPWDDAPNTSSAVEIKSMARSSHADCLPWASDTGARHQLHLGKMALSNGE